MTVNWSKGVNTCFHSLKYHTTRNCANQNCWKNKLLNFRHCDQWSHTWQVLGHICKPKELHPGALQILFPLMWRRRPCNCDDLGLSLVGDHLNELQNLLENMITVVWGKKLLCHTRDQISRCIIPNVFLWLWSLRTTIKSLFSFTQLPGRGMFWLASDNR